MVNYSSELSSHEIAEVWKQRVHAAKVRYYFAIAGVEALDRENFNGCGALQHARQEEEIARNEYMRALEVFTGIVIHDKLPEEPS
jgi:hypothetical protein